MSYEEIEGNLITLACEGKFDVICHGVNCFNTQKSGIAPRMAEMFLTDRYPLEHSSYSGDMDKLGRIDYKFMVRPKGNNKFAPGKSSSKKFYEDHNLPSLYVVNCYTQYGMGIQEDGSIPLDYEALGLCFKKMNKEFKGMHIGLPQIGCGLGGGDWNIVKKMIQDDMKDCQVTVVIYDMMKILR